LQQEVEKLKEALVRQENENYESVAILKEENRKLKSNQQSRSQPVDNSKTPTKREIAALSTEHDLLTKQVQDLKTFIKQNEAVQAMPDKESSVFVNQLQREKKELAQQRDDLEEQLNELS
jgi:hypothetical protein